jgi:2-polyprenyl-3-methyl-5-hydroxy-6-metoxy-1,4-benzoquinol methylase
MPSVRERVEGWSARPGRLGDSYNALRASRAAAIVRKGGAEALATKSWYYSVELADGVIAQGQYHPDLPMVPRLLTRQVDLAGSDCLDLGSVEGLMPTLMVRSGAARVLATDFTNYCADKLVAVKKAYDVEFDFKAVGLMYDLHTKIRGGFDFINCSGLLYHTWSPLDVLAGVRPLLKRNGLMVVSTNVVVDDDWSAEFNAAGRMNRETNTFWYLSVPTLGYLLRYLRLRPVDALLVPESDFDQPLRSTISRPTGYLGVLCRADDAAVDSDDWMARSASDSWEYRHRTDWRRAARQPLSAIRMRTAEVDDPLAVATIRRAEVPAAPDDSHLLLLSARS